ncbi:OsmC family protein [Leeia sp. TBRC 13508]|uniref:OsmC family protein n=1 Tax=Leeia speluncae TaxID=2884804 RepID=A0ABS8D4A2_9NEIS|nr:OsmC family protein [Leeia speluncae]MCB6183020.1 OsmC family protein [Leeia speluncae]
MALYTVDVRWERGEADFLGKKYSRRHWWKFDGGIEIAASSSPHVVPLPMSDEHAVDPEEAFVASLSSCHMLWFLDFASRAGFCVDTYHDAALGRMGKNEEGKVAMTKVTLRPTTTFSGDQQPTVDELHALHHQAHSACFIANSVKTEVRCEPVLG